MRWRSGVRRTSERRAKSCFLVVIFVVIFAFVLLTELLYAEEERWREEKFLTIFGLESSNARVTRELTRFTGDADTVSNESRSDVDRTTNIDSGDTWQPVSNTKDKFFVYSAYYDNRTRNRWVRVITAARTRLADKVFCIFSYQDNPAIVTVPATNRLIRENWNLKYSAYFVMCPVKQDGVPDFVSIVRQGIETDTTPGNRLRVHNNRKTFPKASGMAVCVKPLHYSYNKVADLVEFVELNRILGVDHFFLYNHTVGTEAGCVLGHDGAVTLLPWKLDIPSQKEIRTEGLFAAINDCLYRTMFRFRFVLMIDLDEYILPHRHLSLAALLSHLLKKAPDKTGAFSFQNAFFYLQWGDDPMSTSLPYRLLTLRKTVRRKKFHAHKQRSKCAVMPERVVEMGNHFVWEFAPGKSMTNVPPDQGFLHHYRVCEFGGDDCVNQTHVRDRRAYEWKDSLLQAVGERMRHLQPTCPGVLKHMLAT